jgi:magnesium transporter
MKAKLKNIGEMPGSVIYTGNNTTAESDVHMLDYNENDAQEKQVNDFSECKNFLENSVKWIDFIGVDQTNDLEEFGKLFDIHSLILEDIANIQQRPKIEDMEKYIFLSLKMFAYDKTEQKLKEEQISLVL